MATITLAGKQFEVDEDGFIFLTDRLSRFSKIDLVYAHNDPGAHGAANGPAHGDRAAIHSTAGLVDILAVIQHP